MKNFFRWALDNIQLLLIAALLAMLVALQFSRLGLRKDLADAATAYAQREADANKAALAAKDKFDKLKSATDEAVANERKKYDDLQKVHAADAARSDVVVGGLRDKLAAANSRAARLADEAGRPLDGAERAAQELRVVVAMCSGRYTEVARRLDECSGNLNGLQGYVKAILANQP